MADLVTLFYQPWFGFLWGACWGSFLNVVCYRYPLGISVVSPPSACPSCHREIAFYDNIPVFSWFILRGKCRHCKAPFSVKYALNEAFFGLIVGVSFLIHSEDWIKGVTLGHGLLALFPSLYLVFRYRRVPVYLLFILMVCATIYFLKFSGR